MVCCSRPSPESPQVFVWLDICAVNQHVGSAQRKSLSVNHIKAVVCNSYQGTLLMLDEKQTAMTRMW